MKKILLCFLFWNTFSNAQVQERNQIGAFYHLGYTAMSYQKSAVNPGFNRTMDSLQTGGLAQEFGCTYSHRLTRELSFVSGFYFQNNSYNFLENAFPGMKSYQHVLNYVALPLGLDYNIITDKWQPFLSFTIVTSKLVDSHVSYILQSGWNQEQFAAYTPHTAWQFSSNIILGAQLPVTLKWSIKPSVRFSYTLNSIGARDAPQRPYQLGFQTAVLYNF
jgi:hypothetical protein